MKNAHSMTFLDLFPPIKRHLPSGTSCTCFSLTHHWYNVKYTVWQTSSSKTIGDFYTESSKSCLHTHGLKVCVVICSGELLKSFLPLIAEWLMIPHEATRDFKSLFAGKGQEESWAPRAAILHPALREAWNLAFLDANVFTCEWLNLQQGPQEQDGQNCSSKGLGGNTQVCSSHCQQAQPSLRERGRSCRRAGLCLLLPLRFLGVFWQTCQSCSSGLLACALHIR